MTYSVQQLSDMTGLTPRTLRYYDSIGLLRPERQRENGYRVYGEAEIERLWQILRYREMGISLEVIAALLSGAGEREVLERHLSDLQKQQESLTRQMESVRAALDSERRNSMGKKGFEEMKEQVIRENEARYGEELRQKYGVAEVEEANRRLTGMDEEAWAAAQVDEQAYKEKLRRAVAEGDPRGEAAMEACHLHREWLCHFWRREQCTAQAHMGLVMMYDRDERFRACYEAVAPGCAAFFGEAICAYYEK